MRHHPSIVTFFTSLSAAFLCTAIVVIGTMIYGMSAQRNLQIQFMNRMEYCDSILADLYDMEQTFKEFSYSWTTSKFETYRDTCEKLEEDLVGLQRDSQDVPVTLNYIRRFRNFNLYQQELIQKVLNGMELRYNVYSYVVNGLDLHQQQAMEMAQNDMIVSRTRYEAESGRLFQKIRIMAGILVAVATVMGVMLMHFSVSVRRTMYRMTEYFDCLARRKWETPDLENSRYREFELIYQTANHMKQEIRNHIREIKKQVQLEKQLNEAQMSALRAQVNPHFLFNSLNLIGVTALMGESRQVMQMVEATGKILRYSLYHEEIMTSLEEELEVVEQYLFLQKCRFKDAVYVEIHNDLEEEEILIPSMTIQPIVENCFKHGFQKKDHLSIHIAITWEDDLAAISVIDDGDGFDPEKVLEKKKGGIGLNNIRKRLELMYGNGRASLQIESKPGEYSSVTLLIPQEGKSHESIGC